MFKNKHTIISSNIPCDDDHPTDDEEWDGAESNAVGVDDDDDEWNISSSSLSAEYLSELFIIGCCCGVDDWLYCDELMGGVASADGTVTDFGISIIDETAE